MSENQGEIVNVCPECFSEITSEEISADGTWGLCRKCNGFFPIRDSLSIPQIPPRPEKPGKVHLRIGRTEDSLTLEEPPVRGKWGWLFVFCILFFGGMMIFCFSAAFLAPDDGEPPNPIVFFYMGLFWVIPFSFGLYYVLMFWFYHRTYHVDDEEFRIEGRLFFLRFREKVPRSRLWGLRSEWAPNQIGTMYSLRWAYGKKLLDMLCRSAEEQLWTTAEINDFLDTTAPQRLCCPSCNRGIPDEPDADGELSCIWCGAKCFREEAARIGETELEDPYRSDYDYLRPLESPIRIEQTETELRLKTFRKGIQTFWEKFSLILAVLSFLAVAVGGVLCVSPYEEPVKSIGFLVFLFGLLGAVVFYMFFDRFWGEFSLEISAGEIRVVARCPFRKTKTLTVPRSGEAHCVETSIAENTSGDFRFQQTGKYAFTLINGETRIRLLSMFAEESRWMIGLVNRFLHRTSPKTTLVQVRCPHCKTVVSLEHWRPGQETANCPHCGLEVRLEYFVEEFRPDPLKRPHNARAKVRRNAGELVIEYPSRFEYEYTSRQRIGLCVIFLLLGAFSLGFGIWILWGTVFQVIPLFFQLFAPMQAVLYSLLVFFVVGFGANMYTLLSWAMVNDLITSRTITFSRSKIVSERRTLFRRIRGECVLEPHWEPKESGKNIGFNFREWYKPGYWLDTDPAWSRPHLILGEKPLILLPCRNEDEKTWLQAVLGDFPDTRR